MTDTVLSTAVYRTFAGMERKFELRLGEMKELEQICGVGIGEIYTRCLTLRFRIEELRQTVRLGLVGGGMPTHDAMALVMGAADGREITPLHTLAQDVLRALFVGIDEAGNFGGLTPTENPPDLGGPATSAPSTKPAAAQGSPREPSIQ